MICEAMVDKGSELYSSMIRENRERRVNLYKSIAFVYDDCACHEALKRAITIELAPSLFSIINVHLVDINVSAKCNEIPSLPVLRKKQQNLADGQTEGKTM